MAELNMLSAGLDLLLPLVVEKSSPMAAANPVSPNHTDA